ncbi:hypothetical protein EDF67_1015 [Sphingobacterium sp. JUb78]|nr:hypothetical protein [Sphingobacterium kitahiroshimense]TCR13902.1 hypothetical protein EDF67_1015 [Sphingobacterium sp. JUb78]
MDLILFALDINDLLYLYYISYIIRPYNITLMSSDIVLFNS